MNNQPYRNDKQIPQYDQRRPIQKRRNNSDAFLWGLIIIIGALIISLVIFLISYLKSDSDTPSETTDSTNVEQIIQQTQEQTKEEQTTALQTEETTKKEEETAAPTEFKADLSEYEMYMNPTGENRDAYLVLVNPANPLTANDNPTDLMSVKSTRKDGRATQQLREYAAKALEALMLEAETCGMVKANPAAGRTKLSVTSAYRSYTYQNQLFNTYVGNEMAKGLSREEAEKIVVTYSCRAGTSEHQSGLCIDMHTLSSASESFKYEEEAKWLAENSYKFGFVLRFPEDKTDITGITYEPWHFRYVGRYHAEKMKNLNMCLEEYTEYLKNNG